VLDGRNVLAVMPTGSGKSLAFQLPAVAGTTIVVSPLIALMRTT
jgi:ATP-dependent DNA helicase RecQ